MTIEIAKKLNELFTDPCIHDYEKSIVYNGLMRDPVDTIADLEAALQFLKEHYKSCGLME